MQEAAGRRAERDAERQAYAAAITAGEAAQLCPSWTVPPLNARRVGCGWGDRSAAHSSVQDAPRIDAGQGCCPMRHNRFVGWLL